MRTPRRSPRSVSLPVGRLSYRRFSIKSLLSPTPRSRKRRARAVSRSPRKCLTYAGITTKSTMTDKSERAGDHTIESEPASGAISLMGGVHE